MDLTLLQRAWGIAGPWRAEPLMRGTNNSFCASEAPTGAYALRVYSNTSDVARLRFERDVLAQLTEARLPFALPTPLPTVDGAYFLDVDTEQGRRWRRLHLTSLASRRTATTSTRRLLLAKR